ncbi:MAG: hypothetical protein QXZ08_00760 [Nitrososphaeria archaeon]
MWGQAFPERGWLTFSGRDNVFGRILPFLFKAVFFFCQVICVAQVIRRKVYRIRRKGDVEYVMAAPSDWVRWQKLGHGRLVEYVFYDDGSILIVPVRGEVEDGV